jgi:hypothetical protein
MDSQGDGGSGSTCISHLASTHSLTQHQAWLLPRDSLDLPPLPSFFEFHDKRDSGTRTDDEQDTGATLMISRRSRKEGILKC